MKKLIENKDGSFTIVEEFWGGFYKTPYNKYGEKHGLFETVTEGNSSSSSSVTNWQEYANGKKHGEGGTYSHSSGEETWQYCQGELVEEA